jgi:hypothetical protein
MCDSCGSKEHTITAVINGKFGQYCNNCRQGATRQANVGSAQYARDRDRDAHEIGLVQPWDRQGNPNKEFMRLYPDESKEMFTEEEFNKFG